MLWAWLFGRSAPPQPDPAEALVRELVAELRAQVAYLKDQVAHEQAKNERLREECLVIADRKAAQDVQFYRTAREAPPVKMADTTPPYRDGVPPYLANTAYEHIEDEDRDARPENLGMTEDELAEQTIVDEVARRETERLAQARGA